jgi:hypothetical protein
MPKKKRAVEVGAGEHRTHRHLWTGVLTLRHLSEQEKFGSDHPRLAASLFAYFALEAFLNYIGAQVAPEKWKNEHDEFSGRSNAKQKDEPKYVGTPGKLDYLLDHLGIAANFPKQDRPRSTIGEVNFLRDAVAHTRSEPIRQATRTRTGTVDVAKAGVYRLAEPEMLARVQKDVERLADAIIVAAQPYLSHGHDAQHQTRAFHGVTSVAVVWTGG